MKKIFLTVTVFILSLAALKAQNNAEVKLSYREEGSILPPMRVIDTLLHEYTDKDFSSNGHHLFIFLFNPTCGHCIDMGKLMGDNRTAFSKEKVLFLAGAQMMPYLKSFYEATNLGQAPEMKVGIDSAKTVDNLYYYRTLPQINIYDKNNRLVKIFYGDTPLDSLKKYAH